MISLHVAFGIQGSISNHSRGLKMWLTTKLPALDFYEAAFFCLLRATCTHILLLWHILSGQLDLPEMKLEEKLQCLLLLE